jgi:O-6-methylguanine DNA methyltransferase
MKEQIAITPKLPIIGQLELISLDGLSLTRVRVVKKQRTKGMSPFFKQCYCEFEHFLTAQTNMISIPTQLNDLTPFQIAVMNEIKKIPYGKTKSYKEIALSLNSKAYQAIGSACGNNPLLLIYPCHRVVGLNNLGGFAYGIEMKKELLLNEGVKFNF